jgi:F-type H+-transporting ATPase subunit alpha
LIKKEELKLPHIKNFLEETVSVFQHETESFLPRISFNEIGYVRSLGQGIAQVSGLPHVKSEEIVRFQNGITGMAYNLDKENLGVILFEDAGDLKAGNRVNRTGRILDVPVGDALIGRVVDANGEPLDGLGTIRSFQRSPIEQAAPDITQRSPVKTPLQTGIKVIDALIPIGKGQRELIIGDRQTGKTAIAVDTILNQKGKDVLCIYCSIGQQDASVAAYLDVLRKNDAMDYTIVVVASGDEPPGKQFIAPYTATSIAEYYRDIGHDVLIVYDDLTQHARTYRELSLLLQRPPGREAYPGDIFYIHSRLLERSTQLNQEMGGGSLTALPIIETQAQNISAFIPTNLVSITDGQIYLSPDLFQKGLLPAVDVGKSVSRVGGKAQLPSYQKVSGDLRLAYAQFEELEVFSRFGTRLEEKTRSQLERGRRVRELLKQAQYQSLPVPEQIIVLFAVTEGLLDRIHLKQVSKAEQYLQKRFKNERSALYDQIIRGEKLSDTEYEQLITFAKATLDHFLEQ